MPVINAPSRRMGRDVVTEFTDSVGIAEVTHTFNQTRPQDFFKLANLGSVDLIVSVGNQTNITVKGYTETIIISELFDDFKIRAATNHGSFRIIASYKDVDENDEKDIYDKLEDISQSFVVAMPEKQGLRESTPKLVFKKNQNEYTVVQATDKGYVEHYLSTLNGDTSAASVGGNWDLLRLQRSTFIGEPLLAKETYGAVVGTISTLQAPSVGNSYDVSLNQQPQPTDSVYLDTVSSKGNGFGLGVYGITNAAAVSTVTWTISANKRVRKSNIIIWGTSGSSTSADILVNGKVVKSFDPTAFYDTTTAKVSAAIIDFDVPLQNQSAPYGGTITIALRNNDTAGKNVYFSAINAVFLKDWQGEEVDFWKYVRYNSYWLNANGSSDYAIHDKDLGKYCGSFHGGETRVVGKIAWNKSGFPFYDSNVTMVDLNDATVADTSWSLLGTVKIEQETNINNKGNMHSIFDFTTDGTMDMSFSFYNGTIKADQFFTALTATHTSFTEMVVPKKLTLTGINENIPISINEGLVIQRNTQKNIDLVIRHTKFASKYNRVGPYIYDGLTLYRKYYYAYIDNYNPGVIVPNLSFRKCLDFVKR